MVPQVKMGNAAEAVEKPMSLISGNIKMERPLRAYRSKCRVQTLGPYNTRKSCLNSSEHKVNGLNMFIPQKYFK